MQMNLLNLKRLATKTLRHKGNIKQYKKSFYLFEHLWQGNKQKQIKWNILFLVILMLSSNILFGQKSGLGLGLMLGEPSGLAGKYWLTENNAVDFGIGAGFLENNSGLSFHADYLYHINDLIKWEYRTTFYYGFGLRMRFPSGYSSAIGIRGVAGIMMLVKDFPIDVFFEIAPSFRLLPTTGLDLDLAIGGRYYFKF